MIFECADCPFSAVLLMHVRRDKLKLCFPSEGDSLLVGCACLVVKDLKIYQKTSSCQMRHDGIICSNAVAVTLGWECLLKNKVSVSVEGNHDILVTGLGPNRETARVICVEPAEEHNFYNDKVRGHNCLRRRDRRQQCQCCGWLGFS